MMMAMTMMQQPHMLLTAMAAVFSEESMLHSVKPPKRRAHSTAAAIHVLYLPSSANFNRHLTKQLEPPRACRPLSMQGARVRLSTAPC